MGRAVRERKDRVASFVQELLCLTVCVGVSIYSHSDVLVCVSLRVCL